MRNQADFHSFRLPYLQCNLFNQIKSVSACIYVSFLSITVAREEFEELSI